MLGRGAGRNPCPGCGSQFRAKSAGVAYPHYVSFVLCFGALVLERKLIKAIQIVASYGDGDNRHRLRHRSPGSVDSGILRVIHFGQGPSSTPRSIVLVEGRLYLSVGGLALPITYILWAIPLRKGELPQAANLGQTFRDHQYRIDWFRQHPPDGHVDGSWRWSSGGLMLSEPCLCSGVATAGWAAPSGPLRRPWLRHVSRANIPRACLAATLVRVG